MSLYINVKTFYQYLEQISTELVRINMDHLRRYLTKKIKDFFDQYRAETENLKNFKLDVNLIRNKLKGYPKLNQLITNLSSGDTSLNWYEDLTAWQSTLPIEQSIDSYEAIRHLFKYNDSASKRQINEKEYYELLDQVINKTQSNMLVIKNNIEKAISSTEWNGSNVTIIPSISESNEDFLSESDSAEIIVGSKKGLFQIWKQGEKFTIEDILESDEDSDYFFSNEQEKQDYFNLITQLQNPNRTNQVLTLYTARPVGDREFYSNTDYLPANIFLSNSFNHVDGLAGDLAGTEERRDIYKVKINSKYLIKTLDGPVKYYQVIKDAPVEQISLY